MTRDGVTKDLVLVHGFTQTETSWAPLRAAIGDIGGTVHTPTVSTGRDFVTTALALARDDGPATYVGYSQGGRLCLQLALDHPDVVRRLVLVSASPGIADAEERTRRRDADEQLAQEIERVGVDAFLDRWLTQPLFATLPRERSGIDDRKAHNTVESLTAQLRLLGQGVQPSNWDRLSELKMPVLLIAGELDTKYVDVAQRMADHLADVCVEVIDGAGHACHLEQPDHVAHLLTTW